MDSFAGAVAAFAVAVHQVADDEAAVVRAVAAAAVELLPDVAAASVVIFARTGASEFEATALGPGCTAPGPAMGRTIPLGVGPKQVGALTLQLPPSGSGRASTEDFASDDMTVPAAVFATHAGLAIADAQLRADFRKALGHRDVIGRAKGILMERLQLTDEMAFTFLARTSQQTNRKLREICEQISTTGVIPAAAATSRRAVPPVTAPSVDPLPSVGELRAQCAPTVHITQVQITQPATVVADPAECDTHSR